MQPNYYQDCHKFLLDLMRICEGKKEEERIKSYLSEVAAQLGGRSRGGRREVRGQSLKHFSHQFCQVGSAQIWYSPGLSVGGGGGGLYLPD